MEAADYFSHPGYSQSDLKAALDCPLTLYEFKHKGGRQKLPPTPAMLEGTMLHSLILEPEEYIRTYAPCAPRNTKAGKEQAKELEALGMKPITQAQADKNTDILLRVRQHPTVSELLSQGQAEVSLFDVDEATGLQVKGRLDWLNGDTIIDLKTVGSGKAGPTEFAKQVANFKYHLQAAHYLELAKADRFIFIAVSREFPYQIATYELDSFAINEGRHLRRKALNLIASCEESNEWPGYTSDVQSLSLPSWAYST